MTKILDINTVLQEDIIDIIELDRENYGAPPENSGIKVNIENASFTEPQAWEDAEWNWFYNFAGAIQLAKVLGRILLSIEQLIVSINTTPDKFHQNAGYRYGNDGKFYGCGKFSFFWSSSEFGYYGAYSAYLDFGTFSSKDWGSRCDGISVRFIVNKN